MMDHRHAAALDTIRRTLLDRSEAAPDPATTATGVLVAVLNSPCSVVVVAPQLCYASPAARSGQESTVKEERS